MNPKELIEFLHQNSRTGAAKALEGLLPETISKSEAYRRYGRTVVDRWLAEGLIQPDGKTISREQLAAVAAASNRLSYLAVKER